MFVYILIGILIGFIIEVCFELIFKKKPIGHLLCVKDKETNEQYVFLELSNDISGLAEGDLIMLKIKKAEK